MIHHYNTVLARSSNNSKRMNPELLDPTTTVNVGAISLFSGVGGLDAGFLEQGVTIRGAWDTDKSARETYELNFSFRPSAIDVRRLDPQSIPQCEIVLAGPPCQGFSSLAGRNRSDERNQLILTAARLISALRPKIFIVENVLGLCWQRGGFFIRKILRLLRQTGLHADAVELHCSKLGLPQHRRRVLIVGGLGVSGLETIKRLQELSRKTEPLVSVAETLLCSAARANTAGSRQNSKDYRITKSGRHGYPGITKSSGGSKQGKNSAILGWGEHPCTRGISRRFSVERRALRRDFSQISPNSDDGKQNGATSTLATAVL